MFAVTLGNILGTRMISKFKPRDIMLIGFGMYLASQVLTAYSTNFWNFTFFFSCMGGVGLGMNFFLPVYVGWKCYPNRKGLVTSLIFCFNGLGTIASAFLSAFLVNPQNKFPEIRSVKGGIEYNYYDIEVAQNIPKMFLYFAAVEFSILIFALAFIWTPPYELQKDDQIHMPWHQEQNLQDQFNLVLYYTKCALRSKHFKISYGMMFMAVLYFQYITIVFKPFGESTGHNDQYLTLASTIGMAFNCLARLTGGIILDKFTFKQFFTFILAMSATLSFTYPMIAQSDLFFGTYLALSYYVSGSIFVSVPIYYARAFGPEIGSQAFAYFFTSNAVATLLFSFIVSSLSSTLGYSGMLQLTGTTSVIALILLMVLPSQPFNFKRNCLLYEPDFSAKGGLQLHECNLLQLYFLSFHIYPYFANASVLIRKESMIQRQNTINELQELELSRLVSELHVPRHLGHYEKQPSAFCDCT